MDRHTEIIETLLGGALNAEQTAALETELRRDAGAWSEYQALESLTADLAEAGEAIARRMPALDLVADTVLGAQLLSLGDEWRAGVPEADVLKDTVTAAVLLAAGDALRDALPPVDLADGVLAAVRARKDRPRTVPLNTRPKVQAGSPRRAARSPVGLWWLAAAACLLLGLSLLVLGLATPGRLDSGQLAREQGSNPADAQPDTRSGGAPEHEGAGITPVRVEPITVRQGALNESEDAAAAPEAGPAGEALTLRDILLARQNALLGTDADRALLAAWAGMSAAEARALLASGDLPIETVLGAALFLPPDEAAAVLMAQLGRHPNDPYLRFALAKSLVEMGDTAQARAQLDALRARDGYNGMPHYMEAEMHLRNGNTAAALEALGRAAAYDASYAYAGMTARGRASALAAGGLGADEARMLAAITAGTAEYEYIDRLAQDLLQYGDYYQQNGDYATAQAIYDAAESLGIQVSNGAGYINEQLAGFETQQAALERQRTLADILGSPEAVQAITQSLQLLSVAWSGLENYFNQINTVFAAAGEEVLNNLAQIVLDQGDLSSTARDLAAGFFN
jgi:hypothetical protein